MNHRIIHRSLLRAGGLWPSVSLVLLATVSSCGSSHNPILPVAAQGSGGAELDAGSVDGARSGSLGSGGSTPILTVPPVDDDGGCASDACDVPVEPRCGDGRVDAKTKEQCDDGNTAPGDGCSETCQLEAGWRCPFPGLPCEASLCGDGIVAGTEQCDFGATPPAGCDPSTCLVKAGYACDGVGCHPTVCGDALAEGSEACDDGNHNWDDGCTPDCKRQPDCGGDSCTTTCGDGLLLPGDTEEACDDGNQVAGDGCSADCKIEAGYTCEVVHAASSGALALPIVYHDMIRRQDVGGHPNFEVDPGLGALATGIAGPLGSLLDSQGKPVYAATPTPTTTNASNGWTTNATDFSSWFRDSTYSKTVVDTLLLTETAGDAGADAGTGSFVFASTQFFPLDGRGWDDRPPGYSHNYSFTSELHYWFQWAGGEELTFFGDDDVWVFVDKRLVVDIGGIHNPITKSVTLDVATSEARGLGLQVGKVYEIAVFQAERHVVGSQYELTLRGFDAGRSVCHSVCGDGIVTRDEICDEGKDKNIGGYGHCSTDCKSRGGFCGDGIVQPEGGEDCDDGNHTFGDGCDSTCKREIIN